jgi:pyrroloquinoline-quinone synthase
MEKCTISFADEHGNEFFRQLEREVAAHPALAHPFLQRFAESDLSREQLGAYAIEHYMYSRLFTRNLAAVIANTPDEHARSLLILNMYEEVGEPFKVRERAHLLLLEQGLITPEEIGAACAVSLESGRRQDLVQILLDQGKITRAQLASLIEQGTRQMQDLTHPALFRRFLRALDLTPERIDATEALPETTQLIAEYQRVCRGGHWLEALGALGPGTECVVPTIYSYLLEGIARSGHLRPESYIFWTVHIHCDDGHGKNIIDALLPYAGTPENQQRITDGAMRVLDARAAWLDGLMRLVFGAARRSSKSPRRVPTRPLRISSYLPHPHA